MMCNTTAKRNGAMSKCRYCGTPMPECVDWSLQFCDQECVDEYIRRGKDPFEKPTAKAEES